MNKQAQHTPQAASDLASEQDHSRSRLGGNWRWSWLLLTLSLAACGGSGGGDSTPTTPDQGGSNGGIVTPPVDPELPVIPPTDPDETLPPVDPGNPDVPTPDPDVDVPEGMISVDGTLYKDMASAQAAIQPSSLVVIGTGTYKQGLLITPDSVTVQGSEGTHFSGVAIQGKAAIVVEGDDVTLEGIECSGVSVPDRNGACVRQQGKDLTLSHVYFHDSEQGILSSGGSGKLTIEYSRFERLGKGGLAHAVYSNNDALEIRYSKFYSSKDQGHEIKSRAPYTLIEYSEIASLSSVDSRLVDVPNGGTLIIRDSVLEQGPNTSNYQLIGFGLEGMKSGVTQSVQLQNNTVLMERQNGNVLLGLPSDSAGISVNITGNDFVGSKFNDQDLYNIKANNTLYPDRSSFGLGPFPELPNIGI
ncbi:right-handed parallel beta-helix repeat-containing protein [Photobacterium japonica]|uniref:right-handed parallel beta-helix repeat-containing protein n=1 Tax=Photobacterium japonica TaxID=2910235 RepID=UPI003D0F7E62